jgi:hypothetical protein
MDAARFSVHDRAQAWRALMAKKPTIEDGKKTGRPGKGFDPRAEDWQNKGKRQFEAKKPPSRPFKGGARGR